MWYMYTMEYYSAIKKNEVIPFAPTWKDPEIIILSEVSRIRQVLCNITYVESKKKKWYKSTFLQNRNRLTGIENKLTVTKVDSRVEEKVN